MITVTMACTHTVEVGESQHGPPVCACGERRVSHVHVRAPKFTGVCHGPQATYAPLPGIPIQVGDKTDG